MRRFGCPLVMKISHKINYCLSVQVADPELEKGRPGNSECLQYKKVVWVLINPTRTT